MPPATADRVSPSVPPIQDIMDNGQQVSAQALIKAEVDIQIATAKRWPRSMQKSRDNAIALATSDQATAKSCFYTLKRRDKSGKDVFIEGPSIRCAEIVASCWGNIRWGSRVVGEDDKYVMTQGVCHDLEANVACSVDIRRRITTREGRRYSDDMITTTTNAASAIARRNALNSVVPKVIVDAVWTAAKQVAIGDAKTHAQRRNDAIATFGKMHVSVEQLLIWLGKEGGRPDDIDGDDIIRLIGVFNAIRDNDTTVDEEFPAITPEGADQAAPPADGTKPFGFKAKPGATTGSATAAKAAAGTVTTSAPTPQPKPQQQAPAQQAPQQQEAPPAGMNQETGEIDETARREEELQQHDFATGEEQQAAPGDSGSQEGSTDDAQAAAPTAPEEMTWDRFIDWAYATVAPPAMKLSIIEIKSQLNVAFPRPWLRLKPAERKPVIAKLLDGTFVWKRGAATPAGM